MKTAKIATIRNAFCVKGVVFARLEFADVWFDSSCTERSVRTGRQTFCKLVLKNERAW